MIISTNVEFPDEFTRPCIALELTFWKSRQVPSDAEHYLLAQSKWIECRCLSWLCLSILLSLPVLLHMPILLHMSVLLCDEAVLLCLFAGHGWQEKWVEEWYWSVDAFYKEYHKFYETNYLPIGMMFSPQSLLTPIGLRMNWQLSYQGCLTTRPFCILGNTCSVRPSRVIRVNRIYSCLFWAQIGTSVTSHEK